MKILHARATRHASRISRAQAIGALSLGTLAMGAFAIGALALGALAIGRLAIGRARIRRLDIDEVIIRQRNESSRDLRSHFAAESYREYGDVLCRGPAV